MSDLSIEEITMILELNKEEIVGIFQGKVSIFVTMISRLIVIDAA